MITLSNGYKKPESNDKGPVVFPALEDNIQRLNDHTHDGTNSEKLSSTAILPVTQTVTAAGWVLQSGGRYRQLVTTPAGVDYDDVLIQCRLADASLFYPNIEKVSDTSFYVYINDSTQDIMVVYK